MFRSCAACCQTSDTESPDKSTPGACMMVLAQRLDRHRFWREHHRNLIQQGILAHGTYGTVYWARVGNNGAVHDDDEDSPAVLKVNEHYETASQLNHGRVQASLRELKCLEMTSALVTKNIHPGFALLHHAQFSTTRCFLLQEYSGSILTSSAFETFSGFSLLSCVAQILSALLAMTCVLGIHHNDLYLKNVTLSKITPAIMQHQYDDWTLSIYNHGWQVRIIDFGLSSLANHEQMGSLFFDSSKLVDVLPSRPYEFSTTHILQYTRLPPIARDLLSLLCSVLWNKSFYPIHPWAMFCVELVMTRIQQNALQHASDLVTTIKDMLCSDAMVKCGLQTESANDNVVLLSGSSHETPVMTFRPIRLEHTSQQHEMYQEVLNESRAFQFCSNNNNK